MMKKSNTKNAAEGWGEILPGGMANTDFSGFSGSGNVPKSSKGEAPFGTLSLGGVGADSGNKAPVSERMLTDFATFSTGSKKDTKGAKDLLDGLF